VHSKIKNYFCTVCKKGFFDKKSLKQHYRVHTGEKPYKCTYKECDNKFSYLRTLKSHIRIVHTKDEPQKPSRWQEERLKEVLIKDGLEFDFNSRKYICDDTGRTASVANPDKDGKVFNCPDFDIYSFPGRRVIVSCDEHQHNRKGYTWKCEVARQFKIIHSTTVASVHVPNNYDIRPITWIRFNPNAFKVNGVTKRIRARDRYAMLLKEIYTAPEGFVYMFYDTEDGKIKHPRNYFLEELRQNPECKELETFLKVVEQSRVVF